MENKKYEILEDDFIIYKGRKLYRIKALYEFITLRGTVVFKESLGGYVEGYHNLSQEGKCWIYGDSKVCENARIRDNAVVGIKSQVYGNVEVRDNAMVGSDAIVHGNAIIKGHSHIANGSEIYGNAVIKDDARVVRRSKVYGNASIEGEVRVGSEAKVYDNAVIKNSVELVGRAELHVFGNAEVSTELQVRYLYDGK